MSALLMAKRWHVRIWLVRNKQEVINHLLPIFCQHGRVVCHSASILYGSCAFRVQAACPVSRLGFRAAEFPRGIPQAHRSQKYSLTSISQSYPQLWIDSRRELFTSFHMVVNNSCSEIFGFYLRVCLNSQVSVESYPQPGGIFPCE